MPRHGTVARYAKEYKDGGAAAVCDKCRKARNAAARARRAEQNTREVEPSRDTQRVSLAAQRRAMARLAERHAEEFAGLLREEMRS